MCDRYRIFKECLYDAIHLVDLRFAGFYQLLIAIGINDDEFKQSNKMSIMAQYVNYR